MLLNLSPIFKLVIGECSSNPNLILEEGYDITEPPIKGIEMRLEKVHLVTVSSKT